MFGEESEDDEKKERITQERLKAYAEKKSKKPALIAKSNVIYDVKPWDDTINSADIEKHVRAIQTEGLVWGSSKVVPVAFGIVKLQVNYTNFFEKILIVFDIAKIKIIFSTLSSTTMMTINALIIFLVKFFNIFNIFRFVVLLRTIRFQLIGLKRKLWRLKI